MAKQIAYTSNAPRFSRAWWLSGLRNLFAVAVITALIWLYADLQFITVKEFKATIQLTTGKAQNLTLLDENLNPINKREIEVVFDLSGPKSILEEFEVKLENAGGMIEFDLSKISMPEEPFIPTKDILQSSTFVEDLKLTVKDATPETLPCNLEKMLEKEIPVEFDDSGLILAEEPTISPAKVSIRIAKSQWESLPVGMTPRLKTSRVDPQDALPNEQVTLKVPLLTFVTDGIEVTPDPASVEVTLMVSQLVEPQTVTVAIQILAPPKWTMDGTWKEYELVGKADSLEWRKKIKISGAKKELDQLKPSDIEAYLVLTDEDKKPIESWDSREVVIHLPQELNLKLVGEKPKVNFKLVKRLPSVTAE